MAGKLAPAARLAAVSTASAALLLACTVGMAAPAAAQSGCTTVTTSRGPLTAAVVDPTSPVSGTVTPTGCDIGVYFGPGTSGTVEDATLSGFVQYGVFNDGGSVTVEDSTIADIGDTPFDGVQYGVGVYFVNPSLVNPSFDSSPASGTISGNTISAYQKGGIVVNGEGSSAKVTDNTVTGLGPVGFIAQNGIQFGFCAAPVALSGNTISGNIYTEQAAVPYVSAGILLYEANLPRQDVGAIASTNHAYDNQVDVSYTAPAAC